MLRWRSLHPRPLERRNTWPHQHTQGGTGAITSAVRNPRFDGLIQPWIEEGDLMSPLRQLPSGAEANSSSTNNSDGMGQLNASAGMTSE
jgi:hypothetical protein